MGEARSAFRDWAINGLLVAISLGIIYAGMEVYVSVDVDDGMQFDLEMWRYSRSLKQVSGNPRIGHEHRPNTRAHLMGVDVEINSDGLRDREIPVARVPGTVRIMMLGDSLTFGWGVPAEKTFSKRLETKLRDAGRAVEVINTGVGNYNTSMEVEYFFERGAKYRPDVVVLNYFINDAEKTPKYETNFLNRNLRAYVYFASRVDTALRQTDTAERSDWKDYYASLYDEKQNPEGLAGLRAAIEKLAAYCKKHRIRLYLVNYPELRVVKEYPFPFVDRMVRELAEANGVPFVNLLPAVEKLEPSSLWVTRPDPHPSVVAHEAFASAMSVYLDREMLRAKQ